MSAVKNEMDNVCRGCLAIDRTLRPLIKNVDLFFIFLGNELSITDESKYYNILLCWECIALLKKAQAFRTRVQTAHRYFERILSSPTIRALTNLRVHKKDDYDLIHIEDENAPKIKPEELKFEVSLQVTAADCHIKEETNYDEDDHFDYEPEDESKPDISSLVKKEKKKKKYKVSPLGKRIKTKTVKYKPEDIDQYIEEREYTLKEVLAMRDERKPSRLRIRNMETRCNVYIAKLLDSQKTDLAKKTTSGGLSCSECDAVMPDQENMKSHWELHAVSLLRCHFCGLLSRSRKYLAYHVESRHSVIYRCTVCHVEYRNITEYYRHDRELHKTMLCDYCGKKFNQKSGIERHIKRKHLPLKCDVCKRPYKKMAFLNNHMAVCHPDVKWRSVKRELTYCVECDMHFATEFLYKRHLRTAVVHRPRPKISRYHLPIQCQICKKVYKREGTLDNHMAVRHPEVKWKAVKRELTYCVECDIHFATEDLFKRHLRHYVRHRTKPRKEQYNHLPAKCYICNYEFKRKHYLTEHMKLRHMDVAKTKANIGKELAYCVECDLQFASEYFYKRHLRYAVAHKRRIRPKVPCPDCGKIFSRKSYMDNHYKLVHVRKSQHYCELCDKHFINGYAIRTHKKFVHDKYEKPKNKICDICGRGFHTNRVLINHKRTHTGERPHKCSYCPAAFAQNVARKTHEKTQHKHLLHELKGFT